ncbi:hypothetical protein KIN20_003447 [Parelaphostrongylus tenuis]|uniref:Uncharacterized protein n=1 Tax=Parelaphostrongylus tenuis TaxID=148309 RepID=A0AAD5MIE2_PARTN|nr:hypothetical protein KIN20_003447 [Parelaphostrongylus tenuis]
MGGIMYKNNNMAGAMYISTTKGTRNHLEISESASRYTTKLYVKHIESGRLSTDTSDYDKLCINN